MFYQGDRILPEALVIHNRFNTPFTLNFSAQRHYFSSGCTLCWIAIGLTLGAWINWKLVAGRLRVHTEYNNNALTLPDYFTGRFEDAQNIVVKVFR